MRILLAAGGTGGHLRPALAVADALRRLEPAAELRFLTTGRPVVEKFFAGSSLAREALFPERQGAPRRLDVAAWWDAYRRTRRLLRSFAPDVVAGFGGYPTAIAGCAALSGFLGPVSAACRILLGRPGRALGAADAGRRSRRPRLVLLEQNARPGRAVRLLARSASLVLLALPGAETRLPRKSAMLFTGNPLPCEFDEPRDIAVDPREFLLEPGRPTLLVLGGSQGARGVNRMALEARPLLARSHPELQILLISGDTDYWEVNDRLRGEPLPRTVAVPFETRMRQAYQVADVVVARGGGTTLAELAVVGRPMVLVPYPHHRDRHQFANAAAFERAGAARVVPEGPGAAARLAEAVAGWLDDAAARRRAGERARTLWRPGAATRCAELILETARARAP